MNPLLVLAVIVLNIATKCQSANILYAIPFSAPSHYISLKTIGLELAKRGHNVTAITSFNETEHPETYHQVVCENKILWELLNMEKPNIFSMLNYTAEDFHNKILWAGGPAYTEVALNSSTVKEFLKKDNKFDLVISEIFFNEAFFALAHKYNAPLVLISTFGNCMRQNIMSRNPLQLATTVPEYLSLNDPGSFLGRLRILYFTIYDFVNWRYFYLSKQEQLVQKYLPNLPDPVPSLYDIQQNASLILYNGYFSFDGPVAYLPNIVEIGGVHLMESKKKLPKDLQEIMDNAKHGVVYVNFGSNVQSIELPEEKKQAFIKVFQKLKQTVIWKWEDDNLVGKPSNVIIKKWFPQREMLMHPNIKVFIGHGGLIGTQEALYHGVPIVGIPIYADQYNNLLQVQNSGFGKILQFEDITEDKLLEILNDVLTNESYMKNAKEASRRFKDRPMSPLDTAIFWIEYVIRNNGASYMKNSALKLNYIQYAMLDVHAFVISIVLIIIYLAYKVIALLLRSFKSQISSSSSKKLSKNKKTK